VQGKHHLLNISAVLLLTNAKKRVSCLCRIRKPAEQGASPLVPWGITPSAANQAPVRPEETMEGMAVMMLVVVARKENPLSLVGRGARVRGAR